MLREQKLAEAIRAEREACAKIMDDAQKKFVEGANDLRNDDQTRRWYPYIANRFKEAARAIRARV